MDIHFRDAVPEDADVASAFIFNSGPDAFRYGFSHNTSLEAEEFLRRIFATPGSAFSFDNHTVGVYEGKVVATGAGFGRESVPRFTRTLAKLVLKHYGIWDSLKGFRRGLQIERILPHPGKGDHYLADISVSPEMRGHGIGAKLVEYLIQQGREQGRSVVTLDVSCENPRAQALYERLGFEVVWEKVSTYRNSTSHVPSHRRMRLEL